MADQLVFEALFFDLLTLAAVLCGAITIYTFILQKWPQLSENIRRERQFESENTVLKEMNTTRQDVYEKIYTSKNLENVIQATSKDLTEYLSEIYDRTVDDIDVFIDKIIKKTWTDSSLNCPSSSPSLPLSDTPVTLEEVDGWLIVWKFRDERGLRRFQYHASVHGEWVRCGEVNVPNDIAQSYKPTNN